MTADTVRDSDATSSFISPQAPQNHKLEQQNIDGMWLDNAYEAYKDGFYRRKVFSISPDEGPPPTPSIHEACPYSHLPNLEKISGRPFYISAIGQRVDDDKELIGITYLKGSDPETYETGPKMTDESLSAGLVDDSSAIDSSSIRLPGEKWETLWVTHGQIADTRRILELSEDVFPVHSNNARAVVQALADCYNANIGLGKRTTCVQRIGHHEINGRHGWLVGDRWIGSGNVSPNPNRDKLAKALHTKGSYQAWLDFSRKQWEQHDDWIVRWIMSCAFTSPLLRFILERTFTVHHFGTAGAGKSTLAYLAQSAFGHPKGFSLSFNRLTPTSATEVFKHIDALPLLLDETQGGEVCLEDFVMQAAQEEHKARTKQVGKLRESDAKSWRMLIRSTGESVMAGAEKADTGGQQRRALEFNHPCLTVPRATEIFRWLDDAKHYGHAGQIFLEKLLEVVNNQNRLLNLRARFAQYIKTVAQHTGNESKPRDSDRQLAAIALGEALMLRWVYGYSGEEARRCALHDTFEIANNFMRTQDARTALWQRAVEFMQEHRHSSAHLYADASLDSGRAKIAHNGSKSSASLVGILNAGYDGDETWYFPSAINALLNAKFSKGTADRIWEEFAREGVLDRGKDRLLKKRQLEKGKLFGGFVYVVKSDRVFAGTVEREPPEVVIEPDIIEDFDVACNDGISDADYALIIP